MKKSKLIITLILLALLPFTTLNAQSQKIITGKIIDAESNEALPYASVGLDGTTISNISNSNGVFSIKLPEPTDNNNLAPMWISVKYLGYKSLKVSVNEFNPKRTKVIHLTPEAISLASVTVHPDQALSVFKKVFDPQTIYNNYSNKREGLSGFYREIIKRGNRYMTLNEAILDINKASYSSMGIDIHSIYKGRGNQSSKVTDTLFMKLQGGSTTSLYLDLAKNHFIGTDLLAAPHYYDFWFGPSLSIDGEPVYTLCFDQKESVTDENLYRGKIYISSNSYAIIRAEFSMNVEDKPDAWKFFISRLPNKEIKLSAESANYLINYKKVGEKWYFDYSRTELEFKAKYKGKLLKSKYTVTSELAVTDIDNKAAFDIANRDKIRFKDIISAKVNNFRDDEFWEGYNIIEPERSIESIISQIIRQLKRR